MDVKEEIRARLGIDEVIGEYLELKPAGRNLKALSPFSSEKTPSFMVSPDKQIWHDFSSNKGGDIFTFVMEMEGVDFRGALEILARKAGLDLDKFKSQGSGNAKLKERLVVANKLSSRYYQQTLLKNANALDYIVKKRGFNKQTIIDFGFGYSPKNGDALVKFLARNGFDNDEIKKAGLGTDRYQGMRDLFRGRLMITLFDGQGQPIGFTGRILGESDNGPKYLNTPATLIYDKSRHVFGLHLAKEAIRQTGEVVIVEGNLDVAASHQAGVKNVVATAGTALTSMHLNQLKRLASKIKLSFDGDKAGLAATQRAITLAQNAGVTLYVVNLPDGFKDPDELIKADPKKWTKAISQAPYVVDWVIDNYQKIYDIATATGKRDFSDRLSDVLKKLTDPVEQAHYIEQLSVLLGVSPSALEAKVYGSTESKKYRPKRTETNFQSDDTADEDDFLALMLSYPELRDLIQDMSQNTFAVTDRRELFVFLSKHLNKKFNTQNLNESLEGLHIDDNYAKILLFKTEQKYEDMSESERYDAASHLKKRILTRALKRQQRELTAEIKKAEDSGDSAAAQSLLEKYQSLIKEAKSGAKEKTPTQN